MTEKVRVADADDLEPGDRQTVVVEGTPVVVLNVEGTYHAIENRCCHQGGPVGRGLVQGITEGEYVEPGKRVAESLSEVPAISCPWHGWEYNLETGEHVGTSDGDFALRTFRTVVEDGLVWVVPDRR